MVSFVQSVMIPWLNPWFLNVWSPFLTADHWKCKFSWLLYKTHSIFLSFMKQFSMEFTHLWSAVRFHNIASPTKTVSMREFSTKFVSTVSLQFDKCRTNNREVGSHQRRHLVQESNCRLVRERGARAIFKFEFSFCNNHKHCIWFRLFWPILFFNLENKLLF